MRVLLIVAKSKINSIDTIAYLFSKDWVEKEVFDYTISDGNGGTAVASVVVRVEPAENNVPKVESETISVNENHPERIKLKASDSDERDKIMFNIDKPTGKIIGFISSEGKLISLPEPDYQGKDSFEFIVSYGKSESKKGQIAIEIKPGKDFADGQERPE